MCHQILKGNANKYAIILQYSENFSAFSFGRGEIGINSLILGKAIYFATVNIFLAQTYGYFFVY